MDDKRVSARVTTDVNLDEVQQQVLELLRGAISDDFSLTVLRTGQRWSIQFCDRELDEMPELATGDSFERAWRGNPNVQNTFRSG